MLSTDQVSASEFLAATRYFTSMKQPVAVRELPEWLKPVKTHAAAGGDEHSTFADPHGGFLLPSHLAGDMLQHINLNDPTAELCTPIPMESGETDVPCRWEMNPDTDRVYSATGGMVSPRRAEANTDTPTRNLFHSVKLRATTVSAVAFATTELAERSFPAFSQVLANAAREQFQWMSLKEKLRGTGAGQPVGVIDAACTIEVAKEDMQSADTITGANITKMAARCWQYENAIWLANPDTLPQLEAAHVTGSSSDKYLLTPGSEMDGSAYTLSGRPLFFTEYASTLGDKGDLVLGNWSQYLWGTAKGFTGQESIHVRFIENEVGFRFYTRNDGAPWWTNALTPAYGANTLSPFVVLADRA